MKLKYQHPNAKPDRNLKIYQDFEKGLSEGEHKEDIKYRLSKKYSLSMQRIYEINREVRKKLSKNEDEK